MLIVIIGTDARLTMSEGIYYLHFTLFLF